MPQNATYRFVQPRLHADGQRRFSLTGITDR